MSNTFALRDLRSLLRACRCDGLQRNRNPHVESPSVTVTRLHISLPFDLDHLPLWAAAARKDKNANAARSMRPTSAPDSCRSPNSTAEGRHLSEHGNGAKASLSPSFVVSQEQRQIKRDTVFRWTVTPRFAVAWPRQDRFLGMIPLRLPPPPLRCARQLTLKCIDSLLQRRIGRSPRHRAIREPFPQVVRTSRTSCDNMPPRPSPFNFPVLIAQILCNKMYSRFVQVELMVHE